MLHRDGVHVLSNPPPGAECIAQPFELNFRPFVCFCHSCSRARHDPEPRAPHDSPCRQRVLNTPSQLFLAPRAIVPDFNTSNYIKRQLAQSVLNKHTPEECHAK